MIEIKVNNEQEIINALRQLATGIAHRQPLMRDIAETMRSAVLTNFAQGGRPKWLGLKYRKGQPLLLTGALRDSITSASDNHVAVVGTNLPYAAIHQFGGKTGRGHQTHIDARPFLALTEQDQQDITGSIQDYFSNLIK